MHNVCCMCVNSQMRKNGDRQKEQGKSTGRARKTKRECHRKMIEIEGI